MKIIVHKELVRGKIHLTLPAEAADAGEVYLTVPQALSLAEVLIALVKKARNK